MQVNVLSHCFSHSNFRIGSLKPGGGGRGGHSRKFDTGRLLDLLQVDLISHIKKFSVVSEKK